ncbi:MAG TPA: 6-hydroxymethylpterin diphosphokinase MptE-like protein [Aliidongia sp.]|nr:6-hydroxymethylpterin diphosphokinase MptE-like protein [Aliidongia sp.]
MIDDDDPSAFQRNLEALKSKYPLIYLRLAAIAEPESRLTGSIEDGDLNLDLGHTKFYGTDAVSFTEKQLADFRRAPSRFYMDPPPLHEEPSQQQHYVSLALYRHFSARKIPALPIDATPDGGFLLVYGIGLGFHLPELFELPVRGIILIEEHLEFLWHSLHLHDWAGMLARIDERGQHLRFVIGPEPDVVAAQVHWYMRGQGFGLLDGSYIFRHYSSMLLDKAYEDFREKLPLLPISIGYVEDEEQMIWSGTMNLIGHDFLLMDERPRTVKDIPVAIVGSGPSFDRSVEVLKRIRDQIVIFSCGTGIRPLLAAGIRPDFHCELENSYSTYIQLKAASEQFGGLEGITLIGATTIYPLVAHMFRENVLYFRDSVSSTGLWCPDRTGIYGTAPTCTNLALRASEILGFREIYLFGVDLGTRDASQHHASASIYHHDEGFRIGQETDPNKRMEIELPANFGGKAYTNVILHWAKMMMAHSIENFSFAKIFNCSDGIRIPGTLPKLPQAVRLHVPPGRKSAILARTKSELRPKRAGEMAPVAETEAVRDGFGDYYERLQTLIADSIENGIGFTEFYDAVSPFLKETGESRFQTVYRSVNIGTLMMCFQIGYYFYRRVPDSERGEAMTVFLTALSRALATTSGAIDSLLARMVEATHRLAEDHSPERLISLVTAGVD